MSAKRCSVCGAELSPWEGTRCVWHGLDGRDVRHLSNADAATCVVEQQPTPLSAYDIARIMERDYRREIHRPSLYVSLSTDWRFCWAGKGLYGLYRHHLFPGPRNLQGIGSLFLSAAAPMSLETLAFAMRWCGYTFADFSLLSSLRNHAPVAAQLTGADAADARAWFLSVPSESRMRRHLEVQRFVPKHQQIDGLIERCRDFIRDAEAERTRRVGDAAPAEVADPQVASGSDGNYAPSGDLTRVNYDATLATAREHGRPWLDGSSKPIVHILRRRGATWADKAEREAIIAEARRSIFGERAGPSDNVTDAIGGNEGSVEL